MKNVLSVLFILTMVSSCSKDDNLGNIRSQVLGKWEIEKRVCGECPVSFTTYPPGNGNIIVLFDNGAFERRIHDSIAFSGNFSLRKTAECGNADSDIAISTNENGGSGISFVQVQADTLRLSTPYCYADGVDVTYRRLQ